MWSLCTDHHVRRLTNKAFLDNLEKFIFVAFSVHPHFNGKYLKTGPVAKGAHLEFAHILENSSGSIDLTFTNQPNAFLD